MPQISNNPSPGQDKSPEKKQAAPEKQQESALSNGTVGKPQDRSTLQKENVSKEAAPATNTPQNQTQNPTTPQPGQTQPAQNQAQPEQDLTGKGTTGIEALDNAIWSIHPAKRLKEGASVSTADYAKDLNIVLSTYREHSLRGDDLAKKVKEQTIVALTTIWNDPGRTPQQQKLAEGLKDIAINGPEGFHRLESWQRGALLQNTALRSAVVTSVSNKLGDLLVNGRAPANAEGVRLFTDPAKALDLARGAKELANISFVSAKDRQTLIQRVIEVANVANDKYLASSALMTSSVAERKALYNLTGDSQSTVRASIVDFLAEKIKSPKTSPLDADLIKEELKNLRTLSLNDPKSAEANKKVNDVLEHQAKTVGTTLWFSEFNKHLTRLEGKRGSSSEAELKQSLKYLSDLGPSGAIVKNTEKNENKNLRFTKEQEQYLKNAVTNLMKEQPKLAVAALNGEFGHNPPQYITDAALSAQLDIKARSFGGANQEALRNYYTRTLDVAVKSGNPLTENQAYNLNRINSYLKDSFYALDDKGARIKPLAWGSVTQKERNTIERENKYSLTVVNSVSDKLDKTAVLLGDLTRLTESTAKAHPELFTGGADAKNTNRQAIIALPNKLREQQLNPKSADYNHFLKQRIDLTPQAPIPNPPAAQPATKQGPVEPGPANRNRPPAASLGRPINSATERIATNYENLFGSSVNIHQARLIGLKMPEVLSNPRAAAVKLKRDTESSTTLAA